ncbi:MAG: NAD(P)H-dependent glycerol-3-phosphate dehydrogenase, partial [Oscillospiraceae bacterium]
SSFRIYVNDDVIGVELGAALKNVIALAAGCCDGLGHGDNAKAALMTRGLTEIARLGMAMGAKTETFAGLSGMGDLIVTCTSMHSRNRRCGILIGQGKTSAEAIKEIGMTVEGYSSAKSAYELAKKHKVEMPIIEQAYKVLYENKEPSKAIMELMSRPKRHESEVIWLLSK